MKINLFFRASIALACILLLSAHSLPVSASNSGLKNASKENSISQQSANKVSGIVSDENGETLIGVSVSIKGTQIGTVTDTDGRYSVNASSGAILIFKYIGFNTQEETIVGSSLNITLSTSQQLLDEVIVVGYGIQKKSVVTAAISSVKAADLGKAAPSRVENVLKGQVSGVQITSNSGQPGAASSVRIRGMGTINNSDPLYIIDGMAVDGGINNINPSDIESIEVLKDAASAAVYGSRAANGVILITTKNGTKGKTKINYDMSYGLQNPWKKKSVLNAQQYMTIRNEMETNDGGDPIYLQSELIAAKNGQVTNTNWQDEVFNSDAPVVNHQLSISGGNDKSSFFLSLGYFDQEGIIGGNYGVSNYNRWTIRANNIYEILNTQKERSFLNKVSVGMNVSYARAKSTGVPGGTNSEFGSVLGSAIGLSPLMDVYASADRAAAILAAHPYAVTNADGRVYETSPAGFQEIVNPLGLLERPDRNRNNEDKFIGTFFAEIDLLKNLKFKTSYGVDLAFWGADGYRFPYYLSDMIKAENESETFATSSMNRGSTWQLENILTYNFVLSDKHNFALLAGQSARKGRTRNLYGQDFDLLAYIPSMATINSATAMRDLERTTGGTSTSTLASYFGRADYNFDERYMLQATVRRDGSDKFGANNKWGTFPSASLGWNVSNETFVKDAIPNWLSYMKLRASWGINGNQNIEQFAYASLMDGGQNYYYGTGNDEQMIYGTSGGRIPNPNLKWEESTQTNIGTDLRFLNNALTFTFDYYKKRTEGMLKEQPIPGYVGKRPPIANAGTMENWGLEFDLGYRFSVSDFNFGVKANASYMQNKLIDLGMPVGWESWGGSGAAGLDDFIFARNNMTWPYFYGWKTDGLLQTQQEADEYNSKYGANAMPGDVRFVDIDGNNVIDDKDRTEIGKGTPDWSFGFTLNAEYKGFDMYAFFQGVTGNSIFDVSQRADIPGINRPSWILDRWTSEGSSNFIPRMTRLNENRNWRSSDLYIKDGSYCRLKNMQIGYTVPANIIKKAGLERLRIYIGAENLFTITGYDGFDPEIGSNNDGDNRDQGVDKGIYPQARTFTFGLSIAL